MYACMTPIGFDTSDKFENHCSRVTKVNFVRNIPTFSYTYQFGIGKCVTALMQGVLELGSNPGYEELSINTKPLISLTVNA